MNTKADLPVPQPADSISDNWQFLSTIIWGVGVGVIFFVLQIIAVSIVVLRGQTDLSEQNIRGLLESASSNGFVPSIATFVTTLVCRATCRRHCKTKETFQN